MVAASEYSDPVIVDLVNKPMLLIDTPGPTTLQLVL